jgi:hypothetical protein
LEERREWKRGESGREERVEGSIRVDERRRRGRGEKEGMEGGGGRERRKGKGVRGEKG